MKKRMIALSLTLLLGLLLWSCAVQPNQEEEGLMLWFAGDTGDWSSDTRAVDSVPYQGGEPTVDGLMAALLAGPDKDSGLVSPFPAGVRLLGWQLDRDGLLWVDLSESYGSLTGIDLTLADYCIALTLGQLDGVERVSVTVSGRRLGYRYRQELSGDQVIFSGAEEKPVEKSVPLYFPRAAGRGLGIETRVFQLTEDDVLAEIVTRGLLAGPEDGTLAAVVPEGTELRSVRLEDGVCAVDFSGTFLSGMPEDETGQALVVYSIVNTLGNLDSVESVRLRVEGESLTRYGGILLPDPLEPDFGLVDSD